MVFPGTPLRPGRFTNRVRTTGSSYSNIQTDDGVVSTTEAEQTLKIIGANGVSVSAVDGTPDTITISLEDGTVPTWYEDEYVPTDSQITFLLNNVATNTQSVFFIINGVVYDDADDYTVSGSTVTWTNSLFNMAIDDKVLIKYY